ncbi:MAG: addiction module protein [Acidobacteriota bacterium]|nr:addiction module protein [Acidobacteriota bacterium]
MSLDDQELLSAVLDLPPDRRVVIAERIYDSLSSDQHRDVACIEEAEARLDAFYRGEVKTIPADEVLEEFLGSE